MDKSIVIHKKAATEFPGLSGGFLPLGETTLMNQIYIHIPVTITLSSTLIENRKCIKCANENNRPGGAEIS